MKNKLERAEAKAEANKRVLEIKEKESRMVARSSNMRSYPSSFDYGLRKMSKSLFYRFELHKV